MQLVRDSIDFAKYNQPPSEAAHIKPASDWCDAVIDRLYGQSQAPATMLPWSKTHPHVALRGGEVSIWAGINGHGKSILVSHVMLSAMAQSERVLIASMEMKPAATMARMARQAAMCREPSIAFIKQFHAWTDQKLWLYDQQSTVKSDRILAVGALRRPRIRYPALRRRLIDEVRDWG